MSDVKRDADNNFNPLDHIMGVSQASDIWGLDPSTIKKMCSSGRIPAIKIGDTWIMRKDQERPMVQKNYFVWKDYVIISNTPMTSNDLSTIDRYDSEMLYFRAVIFIKHLSDLQESGYYRSSMKESLINTLQKIVDWEKFIYHQENPIPNDNLKTMIIEKIEGLLEKEK
jgi:hypothetical protein